MLSGPLFVRQSLELHLFFARIMKEHTYFLAASFTPRDKKMALQADEYKKEFENLLAEAISLSNGTVSPGVMKSGEVVTPYTLNAEMASAFFTGMPINTALTQSETGIKGGEPLAMQPMLEERVASLNLRAISLINGLIQFKNSILTSVLSCKMFTWHYPLMVDHIIREARFYLDMVQKLQNRQIIDIDREHYEMENNWDRIMSEHAKFIRGMLDPSENELFMIANNFGNEFDRLTNEAKVIMDRMHHNTGLTNETITATKQLRDFKAQSTQGILECKIKSIIIPLLSDHVLREANHYLRLLRTFEM